MELRTVSLIVLAAITALIVVFYQYFYKSQRKGSLKIVLAALRFSTLFCGLLLLINPKFVDSDYFLEKANLIFLVDDSASMETASTPDVLANIIANIKENPNIKERFNLHQYAFGAALQQTDSIHFNKSSTDISNALSTINEVFLKGNDAVVLITDGNQTFGRDYEFLNLNDNLSVYPLIVGDTTQYEDLSIALVNVNKYAFLNNKFPIEATVLYQGRNTVNTTLTISIDSKKVHQERVQLSSGKNSHTVNILTEAKTVGVKTIKVEVGSLDDERNKANNFKETAIEVIDEKTSVIIVSDMLHPDIGALKKAIESNEQRVVTMATPTDAASLDSGDVFILYQPNNNFKEVYDFLQRANKNYWTITGTRTDWSFLNQIQQSFQKEDDHQSEEISPVLNNAFGIFGLGDFDVYGFPPLKDDLGDVLLKKNNQTLMYQQMKGVTLKQPLFAILTEGKHREAVLFGEDIWRWRAQSFRNDQSFQKFDAFIGNLMVYLGSNDQRNRLELEYPLIFENSGVAGIRASYFDESYQFDSNASLSIKVEDKDNDFLRESPMLLKGAYFEADLSDLKSGEYQFTVTVKDHNLKRSGSFRILDFDPESQFTSTNYKKLERLAQNSHGKGYFLDQVDSLIGELANSQQFLPVQKSRENVVSLIDFRILLGLMALTLALEWFIRKYHGLI